MQNYGKKKFLNELGNREIMIEKNDWRLMGQEKYLTGVLLIHETYKKPSETWDHHHCSFCTEKFMESENYLRAGYTTENHKYWICKECFEDFKELFKWKILES
jgi:formylmethanofuran dehydrogenase subunit E